MIVNQDIVNLIFHVIDAFNELLDLIDLQIHLVELLLFCLTPSTEI